MMKMQISIRWHQTIGMMRPDSDCLGNDDYDQDGDGDAIEELGGDCNEFGSCHIFIGK